MKRVSEIVFSEVKEHNKYSEYNIYTDKLDYSRVCIVK